MARTGRRPGRSGTREAILRAAVASFNGRGYDGTSVRAVAADAGVDPALVHHYFGTKSDLFAAALTMPATPSRAVDDALDGPREELGERCIRAFLTVWDAVDGAPMAGLLRSAATNDAAAAMLREYAQVELMPRIRAAVAGPERELRASLLLGHLIGIGMARHILRIEPLASAEAADVVRTAAPILQRYLDGPLG